MRVWAEQSPFDLKDSLKRRGYRWSDGSDGRPRSWYVDVDEGKLDDEIAFLKTEIYLRNVEPRLQTLTAFGVFAAMVVRLRKTSRRSDPSTRIASTTRPPRTQLPRAVADVYDLVQQVEASQTSARSGSRRSPTVATSEAGEAEEALRQLREITGARGLPKGAAL
jgi:hypothetical protein